MAQISTSLVNVANGAELGDSAQVVIQEAPRRAAQPGEVLIVFMDFPDAPPDTLAEIGQAVCDSYWRSAGSQTAALSDAIARGAAAALKINRGAVHPLEGSLTCVAADAARVVVAQAGPALAFFRGADGSFGRVMPAQLQAPLGAARVDHPDFSNFPWMSGDALVITGERSCRGVNDRLISRCMAKGEARLVAGFLNANVKQGSLIGVALTLTDTVAYSVPLGAGAATAVAAPAPPVAAPTPTPARIAPAIRSAAPEGPGFGSRLAAGARDALGRAGRALGAGLSRFGVAAKRALGELAVNTLPEPPRALDATERSQAAMAGLRAATVLLPILVAVIVSLLYLNLGGEAERIQLADTARALVAQASVEGQDPASEGVVIQRALDTIAEYQTRAPNDRAFDKPRVVLSARLDQLRRITRVALTAVYEFQTDSRERRISASTLGAFVVDRATGAADHLVRNAGRPNADALQLILPQQPKGSQLRDVAWATSIGDRWRTEGAILIGAENGFEYRAAENLTTAFRWPTNTLTVTSQIAASELWNGNVYLLDTGVGQIWKAIRQVDGTFKGESYFQAPYGPLTSTVDIAIDGAVYVLQKNGGVLKYLASAPAPFKPATPEPIGRSVALALSAPEQLRGSVFVADAENGAVWQLTKTGEFQRQYRPPGNEFVNMVDMSVDPVNSLVYVLTPKRLFAFRYST